MSRRVNNELLCLIREHLKDVLEWITLNFKRNVISYISNIFEIG